MSWTNTQDVLDFLVAQHRAVVWGIVFVGSFVEYVFPPFPGDTVVIAGAALVGAYGWHPVPVFAAATGGAVLGATLDFFFGKRVLGPMLARRSEDDALRRRVAWVLAGFRRWGEAFLLLNRFFPGIRAVFFVAAGSAGLRPGRAIAFAAVGAALWNALLIGAGWWAGSHVDRLAAIAQGLGAAGWILLAAVTVTGTALWLRARRRRKEAPPS